MIRQLRSGIVRRKPYFCNIAKADMLRQTQQQKSLQKLSPQQIQMMKLLQVPTASVEERIKEEMEENPALEYSSDSQNYDEDEYGLNEKEDQSELQEEQSEGIENIDIDDFLRHEDDGNDYSYGDDYYNNNDS